MSRQDNIRLRILMIVIVTTVIPAAVLLAEPSLLSSDPGDHFIAVIGSATSVLATRLVPQAVEDRGGHGWCGTHAELPGHRQPVHDERPYSRYVRDLNERQCEIVRSLLLARRYEDPEEWLHGNGVVYLLSFPGDQGDLDIAFDSTCHALRMTTATGWRLDMTATYSVRKEWLDLFYEVFTEDLE